MRHGSSNPYYISPAVADISPVLEGIGSLIKSSRDEKKKADTKAGLMKAFDSGDPNAIASYMAENPNAAPILDSMLGVRNKATKANLLESTRTFLANPTPETLAEVTQNRANFVTAQGGKPAETEMSPELFAQNPDRFIRDAESIYSSLASPQEWKAYQKRKGVGGEPLDYLGAKTFAYGAGNGMMQRGRLGTEGEVIPIGKPYEPRNPYLDVGTEFVNPNDPQASVRKRLAEAEFQKKEGVANQKRMEAFPVSLDKAESGLESIDFLNEELDTLANTATGWTTGWGSLAKNLPATDAGKWQTIKTGVLSGLGLDKIAEMKSQSSTGATGFGALNEKELELLVSYRGKLEQANDAASIKRIIGRMQKLLANSRQRIVTRIKNEREWFNRKSEKYGYDPVGIREDPANLVLPLPEGVTEDDVSETMRANNMTREQVMERLNAR